MAMKHPSLNGDRESLKRDLEIRYLKQELPCPEILCVGADGGPQLPIFASETRTTTSPETASICWVCQKYTEPGLPLI